ncbi:MAG: aminotransferase class IV [Candidatus Neomarinimicrobiota bacterium]|nr:MAG: aminotransferase class IV [Candidatus Neomarinimicrobiota bacterium]
MGTHDVREDPRNEQILIYINGRLFPRAEATVSVFDSGFLLGDGVWEGIRLHHGRLVFGDRHFRRLYEGARAIDLDIGLEPAQLEQEVYRTLEANHMRDGVHIRLIVTRGLKKTPYQHPRANVGGATIVIIPEYKVPTPESVTQGLRLVSVAIRRGAPDVQDPKWNSLSKLNCIAACIQADKAGGDEALMLDPHGFVSTCNSTNFFLVRQGEVWTSTGDYCLNGVTRGVIIELCHEHGIPVFQKNFSLTDVYGGDEAFVTGTFAGVIPVVSVDGRSLQLYPPGSVVKTLAKLYHDKIERLYPETA